MHPVTSVTRMHNASSHLSHTHAQCIQSPQSHACTMHPVTSVTRMHNASSHLSHTDAHCIQSPQSHTCSLHSVTSVSIESISSRISPTSSCPLPSSSVRSNKSRMKLHHIALWSASSKPQATNSDGAASDTSILTHTTAAWNSPTNTTAARHVQWQLVTAQHNNSPTQCGTCCEVEEYTQTVQ